MSEAASVGGKEALMAKQYVDEIKYGSSYVDSRDAGPSNAAGVQRGEPAPNVARLQTVSPDDGPGAAPTSPTAARADRSVNAPTAALTNAKEPKPENVESAARSINVSVPTVAMPVFATQGHAVWHGAVEADPSLLEDFLDDERTPKGVIKATRRRHLSQTGLSDPPRFGQGDPRSVRAS
ncbi:MAG: hypothetical protein AAF605_09115 [Myxococcota bacterium]